MIKNLVFGLAMVFSGGAMAQTATAPAAGVTPVPDTQIAKILITINEGEIDAAKIAKKHAQSKEVKDFAAMMKDQHEANEKETKKVAKANKIDPEGSDLAKALKNDAENANKDLKRQDKAGFDRAYMKQQVMMHEKALATLKDQLIPAAQNPAFKAHLEKTQAAVSEHLEHAKAIETKLQ